MQGLPRLPLPVGLRRIVRTLRRPGGVPKQPDAAQRERTGSGNRVPPPPGRAREDELLGTAADMVRHRGRLSRVRDDLLPAGARDANLSAVAEALETAAVPYGLVPDGGLRHRVAIAPGDREAALKACAAAFAGLPVYARLLGDGDGGGDDGSGGDGSGATGEAVEVLAESLPEAVAAREGPPVGTPHPKVKGILLFQPVVTSGRTVAYGPETGCDLEFWEAAESGIGAIAGLRETPYGWWVPTLEATSTTRVGDRDHPVVDAFAGRFPDDIDFPVDAVITWVDAADPAWRRRRDRAAAVAGAGAAGRAPVDHAENRYRDRGELRYCLRSIAAHAPWIRRVFIVTDDQTPAWLVTDHPRVTVVDHRELFADPAGLPVFNSHAIESRLDRIPGLAEHFLYFNDDIFLGRPQRPQNYFLSSGLPKVFHDRRAVAPSAPGVDDDVFTASQKATRHAIEQAVGRTYPHILAHTPYPLSRSLFAHVEERLPGRLNTISRSVFRSADDLAPVTLASHLALADGRAVEGELHHAYVSTGRAEEIARLPGLAADRWSDAFCLADDDTAPGLSAEEQQRAVTAFLAAYFPVPSPYER
ncbi:MULTISPECIES: Stealth CR1 domain-containing protein [unclassified Streptomyces]|uniref:Stealth CR1 domain-containing protein n=1 Tax=unclassified Streptomyces TaxID=2593676 RepID=UPI00332FEB05